MAAGANFKMMGTDRWRDEIGAGVVAVQKYGAGGLVDPRPYTVGRISEAFKIYPNIGVLLPAMG